MVPFCFSTIFAALENRFDSFMPSDRAVLSDWRRKLRIFGLILGEMDSFSESKQASGNGVDLQTILIAEILESKDEIEDDEELRAYVEKKREDRSRKDLRMGDAMTLEVTQKTGKSGISVSSI
ncbi:unnamed protein product [Fraxinus pennsylvanica]|uniref:Uncharacterized protein n=1 Tax=Fraxinus pennsylvanica TaxID=56036 RepID=A0AAD2A8C2_9LAMI|nr:unnamed protein product [Fraxinus pennsylvanica]